MTAAPLIAPSILAANFARLGDDVAAQAGAGLIGFHPEASRHVDRTLAWLDHVLDKLDLVMLMSVNPGFGGQRFIASSLPKLAQVRQRLDAHAAQTGCHIRLEVDGGVKPENIAEIARAGAADRRAA